MTEMFLDFETKSAVDLKSAGLHKYASHASTDIYCMAYALNDDPVQLWKSGDSLPKDFLEAMAGDYLLIAHNLHFEAILWQSVLTPKYGFPMFDLEKTACSMAMAYAMALPASLEKVALALGLEVQKDMKGSRIAVQVSQPRSQNWDGSYEWWEDTSKFEILYEYCKQDVNVQREVYRRLLNLSEKEKRVWLLDYKINARGTYCDLPLIESAINIVEAEKARLDERMRKVTNNAVGTCNATAQILAFLAANGVDKESVSKGEVTDLLKTKLPPAVKECLEIRQEAAKSSTSKLMAMKNRAGEDQRMRGLFQYHGARTGRFAGRGPQLQNFKRLPYSEEEVETILQYVATGNLDDMSLFFSRPMETISRVLRGFIIAPPGKILLGADFSAIEARVLAWLAGQDDVIEIFRGHGKIYEYVAAQIFKKNLEQVTKAERQIGKVAVLALGYAGGKGAFQNMARAYNVVVSDAEAEAVKLKWRLANAHIVRYWYALEEAAMLAVNTPHREGSTTQPPVFYAGAEGRKVGFCKRGISLWCKLPSGRKISYPYAKVETVRTPWGQDKEAVTCETELSPSRKWAREPLHGGIFAENITQAVARDLLTEAMLRVEDSSFPVILHAHDEIVCEADSPDEERFEALMTQAPDWAGGLPLKASVFSSKRYIK